MTGWQLTPKQRQLWIVATFGIGAVLNVLIRSVSSSGIAVFVESLVSLGCILTVAGLIGRGPLRKAFLPVSPQVEPMRRTSSPDQQDPIDQLVRLAELRKSGKLSQDDFEAVKARILNPPLTRSADE